MQFSGANLINDAAMPMLVSKSWAPPNCKMFSWLIIQNRVWTADRLKRRGWQNCGRCKLCNQVQESAVHLLFKCRFSVHIWSCIKEWLGLFDIQPRAWDVVHSVKTQHLVDRSDSYEGDLVEGVGISCNACILGDLERMQCDSF
jgi:hypothetical protein